MQSNFSEGGPPFGDFNLTHIPIKDFLERLNEYVQEGYVRFGINVTEKGKVLELYPIKLTGELPPPPPSDENDDSVENLKF